MSAETTDTQQISKPFKLVLTETPKDTTYRVRDSWNLGSNFSPAGASMSNAARVQEMLRMLSKYIFYIYIVLYLTLVGAIGLKSVGGGGKRTRSDIILGRLRTGIYTNMMVRTDHVWLCLILMIKVCSL